MLPSILHCKQWVNADEIAYGISPLSPDSVAIEAGRIMLQRIQFLLSKGETFAIETTLATRSYHKLVTQAQELGYRVNLLFFYLPSPDIAVKRVQHRVRQGGHNIPEDVIRRRYRLGLKNLREIYMPIVDKWSIVSNYKYRCIIAEGGKERPFDISDLPSFYSIMTVKEPKVPYLSAYSKEILDCCKQATINMLKELALHDDVVVMSDADGNPIWVKAQEVLNKNPTLDLEDGDYTPIDIDSYKLQKKKK